MKKLISILMVSLMIFCLFACGKKVSNEQASNNAAANTAVTNSAVTNSASANIPAEYKQVTTNENGVKIYGKIVDANTASETGKKIIQENSMGDSKALKNGTTFTYSEYYSESYGGTVILRTNNKSGGQSIYNEKGNKFIAGGADTANADLEKVLANYRIGNAMADAMDKKIKGK